MSEPFATHEIHIKPYASMTIFYLSFKLEYTHTGVNDSDKEKLLNAFLANHLPFGLGNTELLAYITFIEAFKGKTPPRNSPWMQELLMNFIYQSLDLLTPSSSEALFTNGSQELSTFELILDYIDQNLEQKMTAGDIADAIGISKRTIYNMFKSKMDRTVHDYIKERKIALARHYLTMNVSILEAAGLVGFDNLSYFSRLFKTYTGQSPPRAFKKSLDSNSESYGRRL